MAGTCYVCMEQGDTEVVACAEGHVVHLACLVEWSTSTDAAERAAVICGLCRAPFRHDSAAWKAVAQSFEDDADFEAVLANVTDIRTLPLGLRTARVVKHVHRKDLSELWQYLDQVPAAVRTPAFYKALIHETKDSETANYVRIPAEEWTEELALDTVAVYASDEYLVYIMGNMPPDVKSSAVWRAAACVNLAAFVVAPTPVYTDRDVRVALAARVGVRLLSSLTTDVDSAVVVAAIRSPATTRAAWAFRAELIQDDACFGAMMSVINASWLQPAPGEQMAPFAAWLYDAVGYINRVKQDPLAFPLPALTESYVKQAPLFPDAVFTTDNAIALARLLPTFVQQIVEAMVMRCAMIVTDADEDAVTAAVRRDVALVEVAAGLARPDVISRFTTESARIAILKVFPTVIQYVPLTHACQHVVEAAVGAWTATWGDLPAMLQSREVADMFKAAHHAYMVGTPAAFIVPPPAATNKPIADAATKAPRGDLVLTRAAAKRQRNS